MNKDKAGRAADASSEALTATASNATGVQEVKAVSQIPCATTPLGEIFKIDVSLEAKVKVVGDVLPAAFAPRR